MKKLILLNLMIFSIFSCVPGKEEKQALTFKWYQLVNGGFESIASPTSYDRVFYLPWTVQEYIADSIVFKGKLYLAINRHGIASLSFSNDKYPVFRYFYDPLIFRYRTITTILPYRDSIICHVYFNQALNEIDSQDLKIQGISLLKLIPRYENYQFMIIPFQKQNPEWESVGFVRGRDTFHIEWKYSGSRETRFHYTRFNMETLSEKSEKRADFLKSFQFLDINNENNKKLKAFLFKIKEMIAEKNSNTLIHYNFKDKYGKISRHYLYDNTNGETGEDFNLREVAIVEDPSENSFDESLFYALIPPLNIGNKDLQDIIFTNRHDQRINNITLPELPRGFIYTGLNIYNDQIIIFWEDRNFIKTGASGLLILEKSLK